MNMNFIILEGVASLCLGISAVSLRAYPFIIANAFSFLTTIFIIVLYLYREYCGKKKACRERETVDVEMNEVEM